MGDLTAQGTVIGLSGTCVTCEYSALLAVMGLVPHTRWRSDEASLLENRLLKYWDLQNTQHKSHP